MSLPRVSQPIAFIQATFCQCIASATLSLMGLMCCLNTHAAACDPSMQSCAQTSGDNKNSGGGQMCTPTPGGDTCGGSSVASQGNSSGTNQGAGNPINIINGNKYQKEVDMPALPGVLGLEIVRHYNSQYSLPNVSPGVLGRGWKLSYETELYDTPVGLQIVQADGTRLIFQRSATDRSHCTTNDPANGVVTILNKPEGKEYIWRWPGNGKDGGRALWFNADGQLVQIAAPTGEAVSLLYTPNGQLLQVRDPQGRVLDLNYLGAKTAKSDGRKFRGVQNISSPMGKFTYHYGSTLPEGSTLSPSLVIANLTQVQIPTRHAPIQRTYHYENPKFPTLLTGISVHGSGSDGVEMERRISTYGYDSWGKAVLSQKADGVEKVMLDFSTPRQTILTNALGQTTTYRHADIAGHWRLLESRGVGCAQCGPANMRYGYDKLGRLTEQTTLNAQGQAVVTLRTSLDAQGRPQKIERLVYNRAQPGPPQWLVRYAYPSERANEPSLVAWPSVVAGQEHQLKTLYNAAGQPIEVTETGYEPVAGKAIERTTRYSYQTIGRNSVLVAMDGPLPNGPSNTPQDSDITQWGWDGSGSFVTVMTLPAGQVHSMRYENSPRFGGGTGLLNEVRDSSGHSTQFVYDTQLRLVSVRRDGPGWPQPRTQSYRYDALGRATEMGTGEVVLSEGQPVSAPFKPQARQGFDGADRLAWHASAIGLLTHNRYDNESHLLQAGRHSNAISLEDRLATGTDAYKKLQLLSSLQPPPSFQDPSSLKNLSDDFGRLVASDSTDHGQSLRSYDAADRLIRMRDAAGHVATYEYTLQGRIAKQSVSHASTGKTHVTQWRYNAQGQLIELIDAAQTERFEYDARGLMTARIVTIGSTLTAITRYAYDAQGQRVSSTLPDGTLLQYLRNGQGQVTGLTRNPVHTPWLRWLGHDQTVVSDLARDLVGLKHYISGNGIQAHYQRSSQGNLARIVYRRSAGQDPSLEKTQSPLKTLGRNTQETISLLLGVKPAHAAESPPGAMGLAKDPAALLDHRYLWDTQGNLLHIQSAGQVVTHSELSAPSTQEVRRSSFAYDSQARLVASATALADQQTSNRYAYDRMSRRVLSQQGISDQNELSAGTQAQTYQANSHRLTSQQTTYSDNGQPLQSAGRQFTWDALGRLTQVIAAMDAGNTSDAACITTANYSYDHRGLRNAKHINTQPVVRTHSQNKTTHPCTTPNPSTYYLYDNDQQPLAELNAQGRITRQYIYLADLPLALTNSPEGQDLSSDETHVMTQAHIVVEDLMTAIQSWVGADTHNSAWVWLHTNHLGAPEAATNAQGNLVWQARYEAFGSAHIAKASSNNASALTIPLTLHLRLPGQYFDAETGLHYNRQRYYDPQAGQYLTPDPLGNPDGPNPYAYVGHNPLGFVDPDGLVLFAFDGTNSSNPPAENNTYSNVYKFYLAYDQAANGTKWYMNGVGRDDADSGIKTNFTDAANANTARERVDYMLKQLDDYIEEHDFKDGKAFDIDMVGFSRGAAMARDFSNRVAKRLIDKSWGSKTSCVQMRYLGLWDTVAQFGINGASNVSWQLAIPPQVKNVYQAVAMNENRYLFPGEAIGRGVQRGFVGAHADIGGGYGTGDLSDVALNWMVDQAKSSGIKMYKWGDNNTDEEWGVVSNPVVHGKGVDILNSDFCLRENNEQWADNCTLRKNAKPGGLTTQQIADLKFITYDKNLGLDADGSTPIDGTVDMKKYAEWLKNNYNLTINAGR